ncbi:MAG: glycoside hydrolase family protein [Bacteroidales bacterium]
MQNKTQITSYLSLAFCLLLLSCNKSEKINEVPDFGKMIQATPRHSVLESDEYWIWGASMVQTDDGICHLFYSRWPKSGPFSDWLFHSEIAYATAKNPDGPYSFQKVIIKGSKPGAWYNKWAHNPHIKKFKDKYYLYFVSHNTSDFGDGKRQNYTFSQRIGVAVADNPAGTWTVCDEPIVDLQAGKAAHGYVTNPSVCERPDGSYLMIFKSRPENWKEIKGFTSIHCVATSPTPQGPFSIAENPILTEATAEDPFLWCQDGKYFAIVDDQYGDYIGFKGLALFESLDGINWNASKHPLVSKVQILWDDQTLMPLKHLERPQLWFDKDGKPAILFCAVQTQNKEGELNSFNVHIPLKNK